MPDVYVDPWVKKAKWLTQALIISATLNVGLLSTFVYKAIKESRPSLAKSSTGSSILSKQLNIEDLIYTYKNLSFPELLEQIQSREHAEMGCTKGDFALASLVAFHHFNLERALGGIAVQKREIALPESNAGLPNKLFIFSELSQPQFQAITHYAKTEKWPLTAEGLFLKIKSSSMPIDTSLLETFYLTPEFNFISLLFSKTQISLRKEFIALLVSQGNWETLSETCSHLKNKAEISIQDRREFLFRLTEQKSKLAAKILLETDLEYCLKQLTNEQLLVLCEVLGERANAPFLKEILLSPRSTEVLHTVASILYKQAAEEVPTHIDLEAAKRRFIELKPLVKVPLKIPNGAQIKTKGLKTHVVTSGDNLWKIARDHHSNVEAIRKVNYLKNDKLKIGQTLIVP